MSAQPEVPYRLVWPADPAAPPVLDDAQQAVVDHVAAAGSGPLLVLAGPGTGKTTTLVEAVAARVEAGTPPERILVLTFSRKAAQELRARIGGRLGRATAEPLAWTFHAFAMRVLVEAAALDPEAGEAVRLIAGPEQDQVLRELIGGAIEEGHSAWPDELAAALRTRGFANELRQLLARVSTLAMTPPDLASLAAEAGRGDWRAAATFFDEYLDVIDLLRFVDYGELVGRAVTFANGSGGEALRSRYDVVLVDEYQDTDSAQEGLIQALAGRGRDLVAVGDPDQAIYAFRGADVRNILEFPKRFARLDGADATVRALTVCRRSGSALLAASRAVVAPLPVVSGIDPAVRRGHRGLTSAREDPGVVEVSTYSHEAAEAAAVADLLRREHLENGRPWDSMAVLVRSTSTSGLRLRRALTLAGVPVEIAADEVPLALHPAVRPLVLALECAVDLAREHPLGVLDVEVAQALLMSPLGGLDTAGIRRLGRALRADELAATEPSKVGLGTTPSPELVRDALLDPRLVFDLDPSLAAPVKRMADVLAAAAELVRANAPAYDVVWSVWSGTSWPTRLERTSRAGGADGRKADEYLDAVLALFDKAGQFDTDPERRRPGAFVEGLKDQQIPGDTLAERAARPGGVRLLTAHRSKGLEWDVVVVAGLQDELWPDVRRRGSLLGAERLGPDGVEPPATAAAMLAEERRLFYVAATRARERLVVTAVESALEDGLRPSRFLDDLGVPVEHLARTARRPLSLRAVVAELRRTAADDTVSADLRAAAVERLAALADAEQDGRPLVPAANPDRWWGVVEPTRSEVPIAPEGAPVRLSGSTLRDLGSCPAKWLLGHEVRAEGARSSALGFGSVLHALAEGVTNGTLPADLDVLIERLDAVWHQLDFVAPWQSAIEHDSAREALRRFLVWHRKQEADGRKPLGTEERFVLELDLADREVVLRGAIDRIDLDDAGRVVVVDYKTGRYQPTKAQVAVDPQLGAYQYAVEAGALDDVVQGAAQDESGRPELGGAELVQLREERKGGLPQVQPQAPLRAPAIGRADLDPGGDGSGWFDQLLLTATTLVVSEELPAIPGSACKTCAFIASCPSQPNGQQVIT